MNKSFAKVTAELFSNRHPMTDVSNNKTRFMSTQRAAFRPENFRRFGKNTLTNPIVDKPEMITNKDYQDYSKYVND
jgi:hypothetical protein